MGQHLESAEELAAALNARSPREALSYLNDWLEHRNQITGDLTTADLVNALRLLAGELRGSVQEGGEPPV